MGAGKSRMNLKQCSRDNIQDLDPAVVHTEFTDGGRNGKKMKAKLCNQPTKYVLSRIPNMNTNNECICNTALTKTKYSLDVLTPEDQMDEVERVFKERDRKRTARRKNGCSKDSPPPTCCNCGCTCDGSKGTEPHIIERRNGLQKVDRCNAGCQCVLCCGRDARLGELSEAEAIAEAIREYCCKERERARGGGKSSCKCCACKKQLAAEDGRRRSQVIEEDEDDEEDEEEEEEVVQHKRIIKEEIVIEERVQSKRRDDDDDDNKESIEESAPRQRRKSNESRALNPENGKRPSNDQKHAKSCKCCACRKKAKEDTDMGSDSDDDIISLDDIELEVQTDILSTRTDQGDKTTPPQSRRQSEEKTNKCCACDKGTTTDFVQEAEVLMKRKHLLSESTDEVKPTASKPAREQRTRSIDEQAKAKPQRRPSEDPSSIGSTRRDSTLSKSCKLCQCEEKLKEKRRLASDMNEANMKPKRREVWGDNRKQQDEMAMAAARPPRRQPSKLEEPRTPTRTPSRVSVCCECKPKDIRVVESETEDTDPQSERESDSEAESTRQQLCYCFKRKRKADEKKCSKDCNCTKKQAAEAAAASQSRNRGKRSSSEPRGSGNEPREPQKKRRNSEQVASKNREKKCQADCTCKKPKGVPLIKCCKCTDEMVESMARQQEEDIKRRKLAEVLAERLQKRAELQIALQKRLQQQMAGKQKQQRCCCEPPPICMPTFPCCEPMKQPEPIPLSCCEAPCCCQPSPCCCPPTPCCFETPPCCYEPPPCYGQECPCCCQPMPYCYSASCSYPKPGSC